MNEEERTLPYRFRVFEYDETVWLYDANERMHPCTAVPHYDAVPLYDTGQGDGMTQREPGMFLAKNVDRYTSVAVELHDEEVAPDVPRPAAWDAAREEANANHYL